MVDVSDRAGVIGLTVTPQIISNALTPGLGWFYQSNSPSWVTVARQPNSGQWRQMQRLDGDGALHVHAGGADRE